MHLEFTCFTSLVIRYQSFQHVANVTRVHPTPCHIFDTHLLFHKKKKEENKFITLSKKELEVKSNYNLFANCTLKMSTSKRKEHQAGKSLHVHMTHCHEYSLSITLCPY
jgi:hypothetical protein